MLPNFTSETDDDPKVVDRLSETVICPSSSGPTTVRHMGGCRRSEFVPRFAASGLPSSPAYNVLHRRVARCSSASNTAFDHGLGFGP